MNEFDIVIVGGGPAGSATALSLARHGWKVALFHATETERERPGETLPPEIYPVLRELGLWDRFQAQGPVESPGTISAWGSATPQATDFTANAFGCGWHIDRRAFDAMLLRAAESEGAREFHGSRARLVREGEKWVVDGTIYARFAIDATGQKGLAMDGSQERVVDDRLLAVVLRVSFSGQRERDLRTLIEAAPDGWWYSTVLPANRFIAMFFTSRDIYQRGDSFIAKQLRDAPLTAERLSEGNLTSTEVVAVSSSCRAQITGSDWLAVGDSASSLDPLSGRGIFKALRHGSIAAKAVDSALRGDAAALDRYAAMVRRQFDEYLRQKRSFYVMETRWNDRPFWRARRSHDFKFIFP